MINEIPKNWTYSPDLEMLFLFFQCSEECLNIESPDTYKIPMHTSISLCHEALTIYSKLKSINKLSEYYSKYIPCILDELIFSIHKDKILKNIFGSRLFRFISALEEAKNNPEKIKNWLSFILRTCDEEKYLDACQKEIIELVIQGKDKNMLIEYTNKYFSLLVSTRHSQKYVHGTVKRFFMGPSKITQREQIKDLFSLLTPDLHTFELIVLINNYTIEYFSQINPELKKETEIVEFDIEQERKNLNDSEAGRIFLKKYDTFMRKKYYADNVIAIKHIVKAPDLYSASENFQSFLKRLQAVIIYFTHRDMKKEIFDTIVKIDDKYISIPKQKILEKRPIYKPDRIKQKIACLMGENSCSPRALNTLFRAFFLHAEAINSDSTKMMLRNFWIAMEALYSSPGERSEDDVLHSTLHIIQNTYILKILRTIFFQIQSSCSEDQLRKISIQDFKSFVMFFAENDTESEEFKQLTGLLLKNPLLRFRIYCLRKTLSKCKDIKEMLNIHEKKIKWQLQRIYRARNMATHLSFELPYTKQAIGNLHNYFDYTINYFLCKIENNDYVESLSALVFEAKIDNQIHEEILKKEDLLNKDNFVDILFGPDRYLITYEFEY